MAGYSAKNPWGWRQSFYYRNGQRVHVEPTLDVLDVLADDYKYYNHLLATGRISLAEFRSHIAAPARRGINVEPGENAQRDLVRHRVHSKNGE